MSNLASTCQAGARPALITTLLNTTPHLQARNCMVKRQKLELELWRLHLLPRRLSCSESLEPQVGWTF